MYIARILYPVKVLGPGSRIGIWMCGCRHGCRGCANPELWEFQEQYRMPADIVLDAVRGISGKNKVDGFTITGGEPFLQPEALAELLPELRRISGDILVYTGFEYEQLKDRYEDLLGMITVLIDGRYIESRNTNCFLRGSDNQNIRILDPSYRDFYQNYISNGKNQIQNFPARNGFISVGIHQVDYRRKLAENLAAKGILVD
jgi:anaerobic ribonucleoside-triphosphate reductase activating protein